MLIQLFVLDNVYLGGYITPCLYLLFIAMLPTNTGKIATMLLAFFSGLCVDVTTNMLGFHAFACTAVGFLRGVWLDKIILRDNEDVLETPSIRSVSYQLYALYLFLFLLVFFLIYNTLLIFSFRDMLTIVSSSLLSTAVTWILAIIYQTLLLRKDENK